MTWWFTADLHFDHVNIMRHCKRPFENIEDMNQALIDNWNARVKRSDTIVVAGDLCLHSDPELVRYRFIRHLNGSIIWVKGNHDYWMRKPKGIDYRHIYHKQIKNGPFIAVSHYPMRSWNRSVHGSLNLHGHTHGLIKAYRNQFDVGVDNNNYSPVDLDTICKLVAQNNVSGAKEADYYSSEVVK